MVAFLRGGFDFPALGSFWPPGGRHLAPFAPGSWAASRSALATLGFQDRGHTPAHPRPLSESACCASESSGLNRLVWLQRPVAKTDRPTNSPMITVIDDCSNAPWKRH